MTKNMGTVDRTIRIILAIVFGVLYFTGTITGILGLLLIIFSLIFLLTSLVGYCPLYAIFKIDTCPKRTDNIKK